MAFIFYNLYPFLEGIIEQRSIFDENIALTIFFE